MLYSWMMLPQLAAACFVNAHGRQPFAIPSVLGALLNVGLACLFVPRLGVAGAPLATFCAQALTSNWVAVYLAGQHLREYARAIPGVVRESFRAAAAEVFSLRFLKNLRAR